jgi:chromate transporter
MATTRSDVPFADAFRYWLLLGFINFGGPAGQIALMHRELVERRRWISEERFLHALNFCMLLPGPEAQQLAIYIGWLLHGTWGGVVAGVFFVLPSVFILLGLSYVYAAYGAVPLIAAVFYGLKAAVVALVLEALLRIGGRALRTEFAAALAVGAFVAIFVFDVPFPLIIASAGALGVALERWRPDLLGMTARTDAASVDLRDSAFPTLRHAATVVIVCGTLWVVPIVLVAAWRGTANVFVQEASLFSRAAMITFGGAYAVLAYIQNMAVEHYRWLAPGQMIDGLGLAETTPGPLIMVTQFVGFLAAWNHPDGLPPALAGTIGALLTTWVTFVPCFLWIFLGAPWIERLRSDTRLSAALAAITSAVVGVIANLAVVFALHTFVPAPGRVDVVALGLAAAAFVALQRFHLGMPLVIAGCIALGMLRRMIVG